MGYTVKSSTDKKKHEHYETREEVDEVLKGLYRGTMPPLVHTSQNGDEHYSDWLRHDVTVTPDPVTP